MAKHWIFDLDGTLINSYPVYHSVFESVAKHFQIKLTPEAWNDLPHLVLPRFLEKHFVKEKESVFKMVIEQNIARQSEIKVYSGVHEILTHLQKSERVLSLCTAREHRTTVGILASTGLERYFGQIITRDCVAQTKPHPEGILRLMSATQTGADETLMVGDHKMDIDAARAAGVCAVGVSWSQFAHEEVVSHSDHHFADVANFHSWVTEKVPR